MSSPPLQPARATLHAVFGILPLFYWLTGLSRPAMLALSLALAGVYIVLDAARLAWPAWNRRVLVTFPALVRAGEATRFTGASYSLLALVVAVWAFPAAVVAAAFLYHSVGDTAAGWIGRRYGRHRLGEKSLEGTAALVLCGSAAAWAVVGGWPACVGAAAAGLAELALPLEDNLSVPLVGGTAAWLVAGGS